MKYLIVLGDGMADYPINEIGNVTPLEKADIPVADYMVIHGVLGRLKTVPDSMVPESDTANLAVLGYDPLIYSHGRSPLEAASMGIEMRENQTAIRANLVCLSDLGEAYNEKTIIDHSSGEISTEEADELIKALNSSLMCDGMRLYTGVSYRHCFIIDNAPEYKDFARPHDILGKTIGEYLPHGENSRLYLDLMEKSFEILNNHPVNIKRASEGKRKANSLWFWSPGKKPMLPDFKEKTGLCGSVVCAVDLIKGIGKCAGMKIPFVNGATGGCVTDYSAKAEKAIEEFENGKDFVYIHIEAPDECGHKGDVNMKISAIENIDEKILGRLFRYFREKGEAFKVAFLPDHPTPVSLRTHARGAVPFTIYSSVNEKKNNLSSFSEKSALQSDLYIDKGEDFMNFFLHY